MLIIKPFTVCKTILSDTGPAAESPAAATDEDEDVESSRASAILIHSAT